MKLKRNKLVIWLVVMAVSFSFLAMSIGTALNYRDIAETKLLVWGDAWLKASISRGQTGGIDSIRFNTTVEVNNPGPKGVSLWLLVMKAWVRDYPTEDGVPTGRSGTDGVNESKMWTLVSSISEVMDADIPAKTTKNTSKEKVMPRTSNEAILKTVEDISSYAKYQDGLSDDQLEWYVYSRITMYVSGVPHDVSGYGTYLRETPIIVRQIGEDLSQPWGG